MAVRTAALGAYKVVLSTYERGLWGFAARVRVEALEVMHGLHAREMAATVALMKDGSDAGSSIHPPQPPVELALRNRDAFRRESSWSKVFGDPFRFTAYLAAGDSPDAALMWVDAEDDRYMKALESLPGVVAGPSMQDFPGLGDPKGAGVTISLQVDTSDLRRTWERVAGIESMILREQPTPSERLDRVRNILTNPRTELTESFFEPLEVEDLHTYRRKERVF